MDPQRRTFLAGLAGTAAAGAAWSCGKSMSDSPNPSDSANGSDPNATPAVSSREADRNASTDEMFAELSNQAGTVAPISPAEHAARRVRLGELLAESPYDAMVCEGGATMRYLSGTSWGHSERQFSLVVLADGSHFWLCPHFEAEKAKLRIDAEGGPGGEIVEWDEHEYPFAPLAAALVTAAENFRKGSGQLPSSTRGLVF